VAPSDGTGGGTTAITLLFDRFRTVGSSIKQNIQLSSDPLEKSQILEMKGQFFPID
jgi:hypothetical protein